VTTRPTDRGAGAATRDGGGEKSAALGEDGLLGGSPDWMSS
jgi:hypothetical protein